MVCFGLESLREFLNNFSNKEDTDGFLLGITIDKDKL